MLNLIEIITNIIKLYLNINKYVYFLFYNLLFEYEYIFKLENSNIYDIKTIFKLRKVKIFYY